MKSRENGGDVVVIAGIVCGHATFAQGLISAVDQITGKGNLLVGFSNQGFSGETLESALREELKRTGAKVVFTDLPAGSATMAARRILRDTPNIVLVTGTNLGVLLDFVFHVDIGAPDAARQAAERGRACITVSEGL
jgi:PTS system N-acetylgalactosamine-specific IIA component